MTASTVDRIAADKTPMDVCGTCTSPVDVNGQATAAAYIHQVENERDEATDIKAQLIHALEPFAAMANRYGAEHPDSTTVMAWQNQPVVSLGDLRRAKHYIDNY